MYVYQDRTGKAVICTAIPEEHQYWEVSDIPYGNGSLYVTDQGELYRVEDHTQEYPELPVFTNNDALVSALID